MIDRTALEELRTIYLKHYGVILSDHEVEELGIRLVSLFKVIGKPIPKVDKKKRKVKNEVND